MNRTTIVLLASAAITGCGSTPEQVPELAQARVDVASVSHDPLAAEIASDEVTAANAALQRAEALFEDRSGAAEVRHEARLAMLHAEIADQQLAEARVRQEIAESESTRNRLLLDAREDEIERHKARADANEAAAAAYAQSAEMARDEADRLEAALQALEARETERGLEMTLSGVLFETDSASLKPGADRIIARLAEVLQGYPDREVLVEGHTDSRGSDEYNRALSERRAAAVKQALVLQGVAAERIHGEGMGEDYPVASNDSSAGRQQNRRVDIVIVDGPAAARLDGAR